MDSVVPNQTPATEVKSSGLMKFLLLLVAAVIALVVVVAMQPSEFHIVRSAKVSAAPADVFALVNDFHQWNDWSPWAKLDPDAKNSFSGARPAQGPFFNGRATIRWARGP